MDKHLFGKGKMLRGIPKKCLNPASSRFLKNGVRFYVFDFFSNYLPSPMEIHITTHYA
jgi:hypothetical protein